jgi:exopolysaccharide biosynthesis polyprenyl glycosylphosphotransferase
MAEERVLKGNLQLAFTSEGIAVRDSRLELRAVCGSAAQLLDIFMLSMTALLTIGMFYFDTAAHSMEAMMAMRISIANLLVACFCWIAWSVSLWATGIYGHRYLKSIGQLSGPLLLGATLCTAVMGMSLFLRHPGFGIWRPVVFYFVVAACSLFLERLALLVYARFIKPLYRIRRRALIVGTGRRARQLVQELAKNPDINYQVLGFIDSEPQPGAESGDIHTIGVLDDLEETLMRQNIDEVFIALPVRSKYDEISRAISICECAGVQSQYLADLFPTHVTKRRAAEGEDVNRVVMYMVHSDKRRYLKRAIDIFGAVFGLIFLSPVFLAVALAIKFTSRGPVFFSQVRYGLNKKMFHMYKFRSMVVNAEQLQAQLEHLNEHGGPAFKIKKDPRITPVGRFLRRTSLDEFPQLLNVLLGQMSLVGPRPLPMRDVNLITDPSQMRRFSVQPGMTGLWQVSGRSNTDFDHWISLDLRYIDDWSPLLDLSILSRTVSAVLHGTGAA